ncbi:hypothetical protein GBA52_012065 [Prunus armeniaca]|nr:hypothetical protein GBA52_012065 [Prunus armeniaca]
MYAQARTTLPFLIVFTAFVWWMIASLGLPPTPAALTAPPKRIFQSLLKRKKIFHNHAKRIWILPGYRTMKMKMEFWEEARVVDNGDGRVSSKFQPSPHAVIVLYPDSIHFLILFGRLWNILFLR